MGSSVTIARPPALPPPSPARLRAQCGELDICCKNMCRALPLLGPHGLCRQVACIAATLHAANVTDIDILPQNILFWDGDTSSAAAAAGRDGGGGFAQVALFDFDVAQVDGKPAFGGLGATHPRRATLVSGVLGVLAAAASVGYEKCSTTADAAPAPPPRRARPRDREVAGRGAESGGRSNEEWKAMSPSPPNGRSGAVSGMNETHLHCPFARDLRELLPPGALVEEDFVAIRAQEYVRREAHFCGALKPSGVSFYAAMLASMGLPHKGEELLQPDGTPEGTPEGQGLRSQAEGV